MMTEIPTRRFALEEKDLAVEADENNKVAEEKENRFVKKIQDEALNEIKHLPTDKILDRLPDPTGWRLLILPYKGQGKTKGGMFSSPVSRNITTTTEAIPQNAAFVINDRSWVDVYRHLLWGIP